MKTLNIGILHGFLANPNMGCNALLYSAIRLLEQAAESLGLRLHIVCFSSVSSADQQLYPLLQDTSIVSAVPTMTIRQVLADLARNRGAQRRAMGEAFDLCHIFFEIAGGDSFSDIYGIERLRNVNEVHQKIRSVNKPLVFLPQTIGPFTSDEAKDLANDSLRSARKIFARDPLSFAEASQITDISRVMQTIDMACFMEYEHVVKLDLGTKQIGLNPSGLLWHGGYSGDNQFGICDDYKQTVRTILRSLGEMGIAPVLVPHVLSGPGFEVEDDYRICRLLRSEFPFCTIAPYFYTPMEAKSFISTLDLLIGSRMHACIAAYTSGVPVYPLSYSRKFAGLFKGVFDWHHGADLVADNSEAVLDKLEECFQQLSALQVSMPRRLHAVTEHKQPLIEALQSLMREACECN